MTVTAVVIGAIALTLSLSPRHGEHGEAADPAWNDLPPSGFLFAIPPEPAPRSRLKLPQLHAHARVVFARAENKALVLDCVLTDADAPYGNVDPGLPITLSLSGLETGWMAAHVEAMLERWANGERIVELDLRDSPSGPRATIVSASSRLVLPLTTVVGLN